MKSDKFTVTVPTGMGVQNDGRFLAVQTRNGTIYLSRSQAEAMSDALATMAQELRY